ncbi:hypothetical protein BKG82_19000 [Mycobacteroides chelonae]|uniref:Uncharacterized protein n=1 Tax=Mycobacteroides chelonae TaxID=1774 RepID=A0A1S1LHM4_MYCCH|nr:hypothetical protein [Mycobacteroides chelonae]OHU52351.1 hypothetical protein BKG82_19000 [Mycobacteroides chelonae]
MQYFGIQEGAFSGKLHVGLLDRKNTRFLGGEDLIDDAGELTPGMDDYLSRLRGGPGQKCAGPVTLLARRIGWWGK